MPCPQQPVPQLTDSPATPSIVVTNDITCNGADAGENQDGVVETDFLIIGAGPAGASLACFLISYGKCRSNTFVMYKAMLTY